MKKRMELTRNLSQTQYFYLTHTIIHTTKVVDALKKRMNAAALTLMKAPVFVQKTAAVVEEKTAHSRLPLSKNCVAG